MMTDEVCSTTRIGLFFLCPCHQHAWRLPFFVILEPRGFAVPRGAKDRAFARPPAPREDPLDLDASYYWREVDGMRSGSAAVNA
jgi:hypothetical protein